MICKSSVESYTFPGLPSLKPAGRQRGIEAEDTNYELATCKLSAVISIGRISGIILEGIFYRVSKKRLILCN